MLLIDTCRLPLLKSWIKRFKPYLRWVILTATLIFLAATLRANWQDVLAIRITPVGVACLTMALGVTLLAHTWSGWVWGWILREFNQPAHGSWAVVVYLKTNIAKYLPGNIWHFVARIRSAQAVAIPTAIAILSVVLEPLLMAAAALALAIVSGSQMWLLSLIGLLAVLVGLHPRLLNPILRRLGQTKAKQQGLSTLDEQLDQPLLLKGYPWRPLLGELLFVVLRGIGFTLTVLALEPVSLSQVLPLLSGFSIAWLLGLVVPGAPGGLGVFEATAIALLGQQFTPAIILGSVACYRLMSTLAEALGAGLAWLDSRWPTQTALPPAPEDPQPTDRPMA